MKTEKRLPRDLIRVGLVFGIFLLVGLMGMPRTVAVQGQNKPSGKEVGLPEDTVKTLPSRSKRFALLIGVDSYADSQITPLNGAVNDARELREALVKYAGFDPDQVLILTSDDPDEERRPTRINILNKLSILKKAVPKDGLLLFAFSGHGMERNGKAYLLPLDARVGGDIDLLEQSAINITDMKERIRATNVGQVMVVLDACRNNPEGGKGGGDNLMSNAYRKFDFNVRNQEVRAFVTLYATDIGKRAYEYKQKKQGYFSWALVEALKGGASNSQGEVTLGALISYVQEKVPRKVLLDLGKEQLPLVDVQGYKANELVIAAAPKDLPPPKLSPTFTNKLGMEFVLIPAGVFTMGASITEVQKAYEKLRDVKQEMFTSATYYHQVAISQPFYLGRYEVTQAQWMAVMGTNPSKFKGDNLPVEQVSWDDVQEFIRKLNGQGKGEYRLPTEAEWEYACRAGTTGNFAGNLGEMAWYEVNSDNKTHLVGQKSSNSWGLYDMHGNVMEWCQDWFGERFYDYSPEVDPQGPSTGTNRVIRGGSWGASEEYCRSAFRNFGGPGSRTDFLGFRVVCVPRIQT